MKRILLMAAFIFTFTGVMPMTKPFTAISENRHSGSLSDKRNRAGEKKYIERDARISGQGVKGIEGEKKLLRYERIHRIGHIYRLMQANAGQ